VFPTGEDEECGVKGVGGGIVDICDGVFHGTANAFVVVFKISDVGAVPSVWLGRCFRWMGRRRLLGIVSSMCGSAVIC
jgi:hypothetical protein